MDYLTNRSQKAGRGGRLNSRESAEWPRPGAYDSMVRDDKQLLVLDTNAAIISLPDEGCVDVCQCSTCCHPSQAGRE